MVYCKLLKPGETVNSNRYQQQLINFPCLKKGKKKAEPKEATQSHFLHDNDPSRTAKPVRERLEALNWEVLYRTAYSPDLVPSTCLHRWVTHILSSALVRTKMWKNGSMNGSKQKGEVFTGMLFTNFAKDGKMYNKQWSIFLNKTLFIILSNLTCFLRKMSAYHICTSGNKSKVIMLLEIGKYT